MRYSVIYSLVLSALLMLLISGPGFTQTPAVTNPSMPENVNNSPVISAESSNNTVTTDTEKENPLAPGTPSKATPEALNSAGNCAPEGFVFRDKQVIVNTSNALYPNRLFILHNVANYTVLVNHLNPTPGTASAGWHSRMDSGRYSAITLNQQNFSLACMEYNPPFLGVIDCRSALEVCGYPPQKTGVGSFWVAENLPLAKIQQAIAQRKVLQP